MRHGATMLTDQDKQWLYKNFPNLTLDYNKISGEVEFTATYNKDSGDFLILKGSAADSVGGLLLSGKFKIRIEERIDKTLSKLPALYVDDFETIQDRHFGQKDFSACLCSPLEEEEFLVPKFNFKKYFEQLVIPFLYGQIYYSTEKRWPWDDYQHGGIGLLQSYFKVDRESTQISVREFLSYLKQDKNWLLYKKILILRRPSRQKCPCGSDNEIRDCHPEALKGLAKLKADMSNLSADID